MSESAQGLKINKVISSDQSCPHGLIEYNTTLEKQQIFLEVLGYWRKDQYPEVCIWF
jgi:hypothetical protein